MTDVFARAVGDFMADVELASKRIDEEEAIGWVVVCIDLAEPVRAIYATGVFDSPEEAFVEAGRQAADTARLNEGDDIGPGWLHSVTPLYPPTS